MTQGRHGSPTGYRSGLVRAAIRVRKLRHASIGARSLSLLPPTPRPLGLGVAVAVAFVVAETLVLYPLERLAFETALVVVYLLGVVVIAIGWGFWLAAATSLASALAFDYFP